MSSFEIDPHGSFFFFLEHLGTTGATAESFASAAFHFNQFGIQRLQQFSGRFINAICPSQVATVVIGNFLCP